MDNLAIGVMATAATVLTGLVLVVGPLLPARPPLDAALQRLQPPTAAARRTVPTAVQRLIPIPHAELALLGRTERQYLTTLVTFGLMGLALPAAITILTIAVGRPLPFVVPIALGAVFSGLFITTAHREVISKARRAHAEFRRSVEAYLDLIAMERAAGLATVAAMERAARVSDNWVFQRIREALHRSQLQMRPPWQELQELADRIRVPELGDVGKIMEAAGTQGASVHETLMARANALSDLDRTNKLGDAKTVNSKLHAPAALMLMLITAALLFTVLSRVNAANP